MSEFKKCTVVILPTNEKAQISELGYNKQFSSKLQIVSNATHHKESDFIKQYIYIISDDEIKVNDYAYNSIFGLGKIILVNNEECFISIKKHENDGTITTPWKRNIENDCKKVIATTDTSLKVMLEHAVLLPSNLPQPSQDFITKYIEEYNKGNLIEDVLIEYEEIGFSDFEYHDYKTFTEFLRVKPNPSRLKVNPKDNTITIKKVKQTWNKEEVETLIHNAFKAGYERSHSGYPNTDNHTKPNIDNWIKENL